MSSKMDNLTTDFEKSRQIFVQLSEITPINV